MKRAIFGWWLVAVGILAVGDVVSAPAGTAQPKLPTVELQVGTAKLVAEVADEEHEREKGMMFREDLADGEGMVFVMDRPGPAAFWMRNTTVPLSIAYVNSAGLILEIHDLEPLNERSVQSAFGSVAYAIEVPQGWFSRVGVYPGTRVTGLPVPTR